MDVVIAFVVCAVCCFILGGAMMTPKQKPIGTLRVDSSDPDGPYFFLELETHPEFIKKEKYVTLKVDTRSYVSQK